jgi:hypothetical protein
MDHKSSGRLTYDPYRGDLKKKKHWWAVVNVDREITRYYRWWIESQLHIKGLCQPSWNAHISVIRGEKPSPALMHLWKRYSGNEFTFEYSHNPYRITPRDGSSGSYWVVGVKCDELLEIRRELNRPVTWDLHITVGRTWY